jgi:Family of unknown function (DUF6279)
MKRARIIGLLLAAAALLLGGCSALRLGYSNGAQLGWWWLDGYFDFNREQAVQVKQRIDRWFEWHRTTQLPALGPLLTSAQQQVLEPTTPQKVCAWQGQARAAVDPALQRALADFAEIVPSLAEPQFRALENKYTKNLEEMRNDFLQPDPAERRAATLERTVERFERLYGRLGEAQLRVVNTALAASPFDPEAWLAERQRRQADALQLLRRLATDKPDRDTRIKALQGLVQRSEVSPTPEYRAYQQRLGEFNCQFAAQLHNATTPAQRQKARDTLQGWEQDLRSLLAVAPPGASSGP